MRLLRDLCCMFEVDEESTKRVREKTQAMITINLEEPGALSGEMNSKFMCHF